MPTSPDHCRDLFSLITSSSLALQAIVTQAAQHKLSSPFALLPDMDTAPCSSPVWSTNNHLTFCCWKNMEHVLLVNHQYNRPRIMWSHSPEKHHSDISEVEYWFISRIQTTSTLETVGQTIPKMYIMWYFHLKWLFIIYRAFRCLLNMGKVKQHIVNILLSVWNISFHNWTFHPIIFSCS